MIAALYDWLGLERTDAIFEDVLAEARVRRNQDAKDPTPRHEKWRDHFSATNPTIAAPDAPRRYGNSHARRLNPWSSGAPSISSLPYIETNAWMISSCDLPWSMNVASSPRILCETGQASFRHSPMFACPHVPHVQTINVRTTAYTVSAYVTYYKNDTTQSSTYRAIVTVTWTSTARHGVSSRVEIVSLYSMTSFGLTRTVPGFSLMRWLSDHFVNTTPAEFSKYISIR